MILFAFEVDTLEIALMEQQDLVDKIFIVEFSPRFSFVNTSKVIHVVADDGIDREWQEYEW